MFAKFIGLNYIYTNDFLKEPFSANPEDRIVDGNHPAK